MTFKFDNIGTLWRSALSYILESGETQIVRQGNSSKRVLGFGTRLENPLSNSLDCKGRKFSERYGCGEFVWYLTPKPTMEQIKFYAPSYDKYATDDYGFYGRRLYHLKGAALLQAAFELQRNPTSRRVVVPLYELDDLFEQSRSDIPCTLSWQFLTERGKLCMISTMRSNDAWLGMPNDIYVNTLVQALMCELTGMQIGWYQHQVGDLHLYDNHWELAEKALNGSIDYFTSRYDSAKNFSWSFVEDLVSLERCHRVSAGKGRVKHSHPFIDKILRGVQS